jgi:hypothetical protein
MRSMQELHSGQAPARKSLLLQYTSLLPQLIIFRALRARHFLPQLVALLANVLTVTLSGLFSQSQVFQH